MILRLLAYLPSFGKDIFDKLSSFSNCHGVKHHKPSAFWILFDQHQFKML